MEIPFFSKTEFVDILVETTSELIFLLSLKDDRSATEFF